MCGHVFDMARKTSKTSRKKKRKPKATLTALALADPKKPKGGVLATPAYFVRRAWGLMFKALFAVVLSLKKELAVEKLKPEFVLTEKPRRVDGRQCFGIKGQ